MDHTYQLTPFEDWDIWVIMHTNMWDITIKMFIDTPRTTTNFLWHASSGYYDGLIFHRVIEWFMIQWWDPRWDWTGWESIYGPKFADEFTPKLHNIPWSISMANSWPNTNGSQFFINLWDNFFLDNKHSVFGQVTRWFDVVQEISRVKTSSDRPMIDITIDSIDVVIYEDDELRLYDFDVKKAISDIEKTKLDKREQNKSRLVKSSDTIKVHYTWTFTDTGEVFDSSYDREPLEFEVWSGMMIKWFDQWVVNMQIGIKKIIKLESRDAYGDIDPDLLLPISRGELTPLIDMWFTVEVWDTLPTNNYGYREIKKVDSDYVYIDANHPLAGEDLTFELEIVDFVD